MKRVTCSPDKRCEPTKKRSRTHSHGRASDHGSQVKISCDYCQKDITHTARVLCNVCAEFDLCLECFSAGVELRGHKYWHSYRVIEDLRFAFLSPDWSANEEQLLLEGLELFGVGNWFDVANYVSSKDAKECSQHYEHYYIASEHWPEAHYCNVTDSRQHRDQQERECKRTKCSSSRRQRRAALKQKTQKRQTHVPAPTSALSLSGYMPKRGEFETEWDNSCEKKIMDIEFSESDTEQEFELKMQMLEMYNLRLSKRHSVRKMVVEKNLHDQSHQSDLRKSRSSEEHKLHLELKKFLQVMSPEELSELIKGMVRQQELEDRVKELQEYRRAGITSMDDIPVYQEHIRTCSEKESCARKATQSPSPSRSRSPSLPHSPVQSPVQAQPSSPSNIHSRLRSSDRDRAKSPETSTAAPSSPSPSSPSSPPYMSDEERHPANVLPLTRSRTLPRRHASSSQEQKECLPSKISFSSVPAIEHFQQRRAKPRHTKKETTIINFTSFADVVVESSTSSASVFLHDSTHNAFTVAVI